MNSMRKGFCFLMAMGLAAFALPGIAAQPSKIFSLNVSGSVPVGGGGVSATITNLSPTGNSAINSFIIVPPANGTISATAGFSSSAPATIALDPATGNLKINGYKGLLPQDQTGPHSITISFTVNPLSNPCTTSLLWNATAYAGNSWSGDTFALQPEPTSQLHMTVTSGGCTLQFTPGPTSAITNSVITSTSLNPAGPSVRVGLYNSSVGLVTSFNGTVNLTNTGSGTGSLTGGSAPAVSGLATFPALKIDAAGNYTLTANATGFASVNSAPFTIFDACSAANSELDPLQTNPANKGPLEPGFAAGSRGQYNKDGSQCVVVGYTFTNTILTNNQVNLKWDTNVQPNAAFTYTMNWKLRPVDANGWTAVQPMVAWEESSPGNPIFVPGLACLSSNLPAPYGTLTVDNGATTLQVNVTVPPSALPPGPFPIVIGTERMLVTGVSGSTWTVQRGQGGTTQITHLAGDPVMSTPLPIYSANPSYAYSYAGKQAHVCIAEHGMTSAGLDSSGNALVQYFTTVIDIGDGWVTMP